MPEDETCFDDDQEQYEEEFADFIISREEDGPEVSDLTPEKAKILNELWDMQESIWLLKFPNASRKTGELKLDNLEFVQICLREGLIDKGFESDQKSVAIEILALLTSMNEYSERANEISLAHLKEIEESILDSKDSQAHKNEDAMNILASLAMSKKPETSRTGLEAILRHRELIRSSYASSDIVYYLKAIEALIEKGVGEEEPELITKGIANLMETSEPVALAELYESNKMEVHLAAAKMIRGYIGKIGMPVGQITDAWRRSDSSYGKAIDRNINRLKILEQARPGIAKTLFEQFGIMDFGRYPAALLLDQFDHREEDVPYGVIIYPRDDYSGAFYHDEDIFGDLKRSLEGKYHLRVIEADGKYSLARRLISLNNRYGDKNKISFGIIGGHGTKDSIAFGSKREGTPDKSRGHLLPDDLLHPGAQRSKEFFEKGCTLVLVSCSTGENEGIGQKLSEVFGCEVIAPDKPTGISSIRAKVENHHLKLEANYYDLDSTRFYSAGKES